MAQIRYTAHARQDLLDIWVAIAMDDAVAADSVYERLAARVQILERFPQAGSARPDIAEAVRVLVERPSHLLSIAASGVQIVRVLHGARDIDGTLFAEGVD